MTKLNSLKIHTYLYNKNVESDDMLSVTVDSRLTFTLIKCTGAKVDVLSTVPIVIRIE